MNNAITLGYDDIALASVFVLVAALISFILKLGYGRSLLVAGLRTALQLGVAGVAIGFVFKLSVLHWVALLAFVMILLAGREALRRQKIRLPGMGWDTMAVMFFTSLLVSVTVTGLVVGARPWWSPPVFIPLLGMVLGNSLNGISLTLDRFLSSCRTQRKEIEARLLVGATPYEASLPLMKEALRAGMTPLINTMSIVGIVSLPGMLTGQLLAGADPRDAVMYQIVVMYMLAAATAIGSLAALLLIRRRVFNRDQAISTNLLIQGR